MTSILSAIPLWVYPLLLGLCLLGARARHDRRSPVLLIHALPLLGLLSLSRALALGGLAPTALCLFWLAGAWIGFRLQPRWTVARTARHVQLRGESLTLVTVLGLFTLNFAAGMAQGMAAELAGGAGFGLGYGVLAGLMSGSLAGRAISVARSRPGPA